MKSTEKKEKTFLKNFKAFITRGNVVDMAVGVVIGGSFGKIITGLVNYVINPFVGIFIKNGSLDSVKTVIKPAVIENDVVVTPESAIMWGTWIQTILDFLITALCIFVVLQLITKSRNMIEAKKIAAEKAKAEEARLKAEADKKAADEAALIEKKRLEAVQNSIIAQENLLNEIKVLLSDKRG